MRLQSLRVKNFQSLEDVEIKDLGDLNVFVGKNNAGKSAIFRALAHLTAVIRGEDLGALGGRQGLIATGADPSRSIEIELHTSLALEERREYVDLLLPLAEPASRQRLLDSPFCRLAGYRFQSPPGRPDIFYLVGTHIFSEKGGWALIQKAGMGDPTQPHLDIECSPFQAQARAHPTAILSAQAIGLRPQGTALPTSARFDHHKLHAVTGVDLWPQQRLAASLGAAFYFFSHRHSQQQLPSQETKRLARDGSNLGNVLLTLLSQDRELFERIEAFVHGAVPDAGSLQAPLKGNQAEVGFRGPGERCTIHLHDMGSGLEQLLMVATALNTTTEESSIFLEEPESHLHPGAQRYLLDALAKSGRQVFLTTHSPLFVNAPREKGLYQVRREQRQTRVRRLDKPETFQEVLEDIGVRNSDVLLSEAVLFVEGPADRLALSAWSDTIGLSFELHNVTVLDMGGAEYAERDAPIRAEVLAGISEKAPIPHLFVIDRDERSDEEIARLKLRLKDHCQVWSRRELENYLFDPAAIHAVLAGRQRASAGAVAAPAEINEQIKQEAAKLYATILLKRIRLRVPGFAGGLLTREMCQELEQHAQGDLAGEIRRRLEARTSGHLAALDLARIVAETRAALDAEWAKEDRRLEVAPGEEVLKAVFASAGTEYHKPKTSGELARRMGKEAIPQEVEALIRRAVALTGEAPT